MAREAGSGVGSVGVLLGTENAGVIDQYIAAPNASSLWNPSAHSPDHHTAACWAVDGDPGGDFEFLGPYLVLECAAATACRRLITDFACDEVRTHAVVCSPRAAVLAVLALTPPLPPRAVGDHLRSRVVDARAREESEQQDCSSVEDDSQYDREELVLLDVKSLFAVTSQEEGVSGLTTFGAAAVPRRNGRVVDGGEHAQKLVEPCVGVHWFSSRAELEKSFNYYTLFMKLRQPWVASGQLQAVNCLL